jgi:hypothetical protein
MKCMYLFLNFRGLSVSLAGSIWSLKVPLKVKSFATSLWIYVW